MVNITQKSACCGCSACAQICPRHCISMEKDKEGFLYPQVDAAQCAACGLCEKACPELARQSPHTPLFEEPVTYGGWHNEDEVRAKSSSGGVFSLFAEYILAQGGSVYGCVLDERLRAVHARAKDQTQLAAMRGSKYLQSDINGMYAEVWQDLKDGQDVLFTGTPCQTAGLHSFIEAKTRGADDSIWNHLYLCDFICHGVPSPDVFESYVHAMESQYKDKIVSFQFRTKDRQWNPSGLQLGTGTGTGTGTGKYIRKYPGFRDEYMNGFLSDLYLRPSCHECHFKYIPKDYADITIADFWGVNKVCPSLMDGKGTSLLLIHNRHGEELFNAVKDNFHYEKVDFEKALARNRSILVSARKNPKREAFFRDYAALPFETVERHYMKATDWFFHRLGGMAWGILEKTIRTIWGGILRVLGIQWDSAHWDIFFQFVRFCMVGVTNVIVSYTVNITTLFIQQPLRFEYDYVVANCMAFLCSVLWSFHLNSNYVFAAQNGEKRSKLKMLLKMYASYAFTGIVMNNVLGTFWIKIVGISKFAAPLLNVPITFGINFTLNKFWTFR